MTSFGLLGLLSNQSVETTRGISLAGGAGLAQALNKGKATSVNNDKPEDSFLFSYFSSLGLLQTALGLVVLQSFSDK